jgi:hypothetical protein
MEAVDISYDSPCSLFPYVFNLNREKYWIVCWIRVGGE